MIRMSKETDYGIILMTYFASRRGVLTASAREVSKEVGLPLPMVSKILKVLARGNLLVSHRGARGGYSLARPGKEISVAQIINALEGPVAMTECIESPGECRHEPLCGLRSTWERVNDLVMESLAEISLTELTRPGRSGGASELVHLQ